MTTAVEGVLHLDLSAGQPSSGIMPLPPIFTSQQSGWRGFELQRHHQLAWSSPEVCPQQHVVAVHHFPEPTRSVRSFAGKTKSETIDRGTSAVLPAGVPVKVTWDRAGEFTFLILTREKLAETLFLGAETTRIEIIPQYAMRDPLIAAISSELESEVQLGSELYAEHLIGTLCAHIERRYSVWPRGPRPPGELSQKQLRRALEFIHDNLGTRLSLMEIAKAACLSPYHFARLFKRAVGVAPHQYVLKQRILRAQRFLSTTERSVEQVAWSVGFSSQSHFIAQFRRMTGTTPMAWREAQATASLLRKIPINVRNFRQ